MTRFFTMLCTASVLSLSGIATAATQHAANPVAHTNHADHTNHASHTAHTYAGGLTTQLLNTLATNVQPQIVGMCDSQQQSSQPIKAIYTVTTYQTDTDATNSGKQTTLTPAGSYTLNLYRTDDRVIYEYPKTGLADVWHMAMGDQLELTRYFYNAKRSIEYTQADLINVRNVQPWQKLYHLTDVSRLSPGATTASTCTPQTIYHANEDKHRFGQAVLYADNWQLPMLMATQLEDKVTTYTLNRIEPATNLSEKLTAYRDFDGTDFADIGDNEADPFLKGMINMGFIEHEEHAGHGH